MKKNEMGVERVDISIKENSDVTLVTLSTRKD